MFSFFGLGKTRSKFGKWVDKKGLTQNEIAKESGVGRTTLSNMCSDPEYSPRIETWIKVKKGLKSMGYNVDRDNFFNF